MKIFFNSIGRLLFSQTTFLDPDEVGLDESLNHKVAKDQVSPQRNEYITFVKALAIITIVMYHFLLPLPLNPILSKFVGLGGGGVHLFIFASGYGLYLSKYTTYFNFIKKRFSKVIIPYFVAIILIFIFNTFFQIYPTDDFQAFFSHIFFYKMFVENFESSFGGQFWFMSTIIQLYLLFPCLLYIIVRYNSYVCLTALIAVSLFYAVTITLLGYGELRVINSFFIQYIWEFALGMIIAKEMIINKIVSIKWYYAITISIVSYSSMAGLTFAMGALGRNINDIFSFLGYSFFSIAMFHLVRMNKQILKWFISVEPISYSLFLTHTFVYTVFAKLIFGEVDLEETILLFILSMIVAKGFSLLMGRINTYFSI